MPQGQENKGNKTIRQKQNKKFRLTYRVKRPPNDSEIKIIKKTTKMAGGTSIRSQPANFARESNPASRLVKMLLKHYIQYIRAVYKGQEENNTHTRATLAQTYLKKSSHSANNKGDRGEQREGRHAHSSKANSVPKKTVVQPTKATEGEQREGRHTHSNSEPKSPQYCQQMRPRETNSNHTKRDRNEKSHQRPYRYGH